MIYQTVDLNDFREAFKQADRKDQFSYEGLEALFDFISDIYATEENTNYELDVIALCCEYTEYASVAEYNKDYEPVESIDEIENQTLVIKIDDDSFIIQNY